MAATLNQRKANDNVMRRVRARLAGAAARRKRGTIDRAEELAAIEAAVRSGRVTIFQPAKREDEAQVTRGYSHVVAADGASGVSFGDQSRRGVR